MAMDLANLIFDLSKAEEAKDLRKNIVIVEVMHTNFDQYSCAQWIRLSRDPKSTDLLINHRGVNMHYKDMREAISIGTCELIFNDMMHEFLKSVDDIHFNDMDFISIHVHCRGRRLAIQQMYFKEHMNDPINMDHPCKDKQWIMLFSSFQKLLLMAASCVP